MINQRPTLKSTLIALAYLAPMLIITIVFNIYPIVKSFAMSFYTKYDFFTDKVSALGLDNFRFILIDPDFHLAVRNTLIFVLGVVPLSVILSLGIAMMLNNVHWLAGLLKTAYFLPFVTSTVANLPRLAMAL
ncbi:hypothetical protein OKN36_13520 [Furfurilactobacillus sp. OKN36]